MEFPAWDPVLFDIPLSWLPIDIRWYGMMYVVAFVVGQWILVRLARRGFFPVDPKHAPDLVFYCVIGVMLGGRAGYALFYDQSLLNPLRFVQLWQGGLSFHGGLTGVAIAAWWFKRRHRLPWMVVGDACALATCPGIFAVRMANFINGELYGRVTSASTFGAMQFPTDPVAKQALGLTHDMSMRDQELCIQVAFGKRSFAAVRDQLSQGLDWETVAKGLDWAKARVHVPFRHPSQLYEGIGEGLVLGLVLWTIFLLSRNRPRRPGTYLVTFLLGYAAIRGSLELVRQPDAQFGPGGDVLFGMTMGQTLSAAMVVGGVLALLWPRLFPAKGPQPVPPQSTVGGSPPRE